MRGGSIVDAAPISAPGSTKNVEKKRDLEMHQRKKGNPWHFGMKRHTGMDAGSSFVHTGVPTTPSTGSSISRTASSLYAASWSTPIKS